MTQNMTQSEFFNILSSIDSEDPFKKELHYVPVLIVDSLKDNAKPNSNGYENYIFDYKNIGMENIHVLNYDELYKMLVFYFKLNNEHFLVAAIDDGLYGHTEALKLSHVKDIFTYSKKINRYLSCFNDYKNEMKSILILNEKEELEKILTKPQKTNKSLKL